MVTTIGLVLASVAGCQDESRLSEQDARDVASRAEGPVFYVGTEFAGLPLTRAKTGPEGSPVDAYFVYGDCEPSGDEPRCTPPLQIQSPSAPTEGRALASSSRTGFLEARDSSGRSFEVSVPLGMSRLPRPNRSASTSARAADAAQA